MGHSFSLQGNLLSQTLKCAESVQNLEAESTEITELSGSKPMEKTKNACQVCLLSAAAAGTPKSRDD